MKKHCTSSLISIAVLITLLSLAACAPPTNPPLPTPTPHISDEEDATMDYHNPDQPIADRVDDLLSRMTLAEKIGQMTQVEKNSINKKDISELGIGSILSGGGGSPAKNTAENWRNMVNKYQEEVLKSRLGIPLIYGVDAVHGHATVRGATIFPHNIGLGATRDAELVQRIGRATAEEMAATGIPWNFSPVVAVPQDIRWGRTYEAFGENTDLVSDLSAAYLAGLQNIAGKTDLADPTTVLATPKHFLADGGTAFGTSTTVIMKPYLLDQGDAQIDEATLRTVHLPPYQAAIKAGARSIMVSYSSWNSLKMHANRHLLTDILKDELGFDGFLVSDWEAVDQISDNYDEAVVTAINAGIDMVMVPYDYVRFINTLTKAVENGDVSTGRIDNAVRRILRVKFELGLFEHPVAEQDTLDAIGSDEHRELAREAVRKSLVLLKNEGGILPLGKETPLIFVAGVAANDIGIQSGGWTTEWQGREGDITPGTTILNGIKQAAEPGSLVQYNRFGRYDRVLDENGVPAIADIGIAVVAERPYAEGVGDSADMALPEQDIAALQRLRERSKRLVVIIISGRPVIITDLMPLADAVVAAWLPGTEGAGVADALFDDYPFTGKLPYTWPRSVEQLPLDFDNLSNAGPNAPLFLYNYNLNQD